MMMVEHPGTHGDNTDVWLARLYDVDQQRITALDSATLIVNGWALTLMSALAGFAISRDNVRFVAVALVPTAFFAALALRYRSVQLRHGDRANDIEREVRPKLPDLVAERNDRDASKDATRRWRYVPVILFYVPLLVFEGLLLVLLL
jgi:hypothetical protein